MIKIAILSLTLNLIFLHGNISEYRLLISRGNNYLDKNELSEALVCYEKAVKLYPLAPEAYYQIGFIHMRKKYYNMALKYFLQAEKHSSNFLFKEKKMDLYMNLAAVYRKKILAASGSPSSGKLKHISEKEAVYLHKILQVATNYQAPFYRDYAGKAFFLLALINNKNKHPVKSLNYFSNAAAIGYYRKTCYLYIAHYYFVNNQEKITRENLAFYRAQGKTAAELKKIKVKNKTNYFRYYYTKFNQAPCPETEKRFLQKERRREMIEQLNRYSRELHMDRTSKRNKRIEEYTNEEH